MRGDCVSQINKFRNVSGGQHDRTAEPPAGTLDGDGAIVTNAGDLPSIAVAHPRSAAAEASVVVAGNDRVTDPGQGAVVEFHFLRGAERAVEDQVSAGAVVQGRDGLATFGDQDGGVPIVGVGPPGVVGGIDHRFFIATVDAALFEIGVDDLGASVPQAQGGDLLPIVGEPMDIDQLGRIVTVRDEEVEPTARVHRLQLGVVAATRRGLDRKRRC